jgi:hypothetical protein
VNDPSWRNILIRMADKKDVQYAATIAAVFKSRE